MKAVSKTAKGYKLSYKKKAATTDSYLPRGASRRISVCEGCRAVYMNKRWYVGDDVVSKSYDVATTVCPACL